jgi:hypothetical protein
LSVSACINEIPLVEDNFTAWKIQFSLMQIASYIDVLD